YDGAGHDEERPPARPGPDLERAVERETPHHEGHDEARDDGERGGSSRAGLSERSLRALSLPPARVDALSFQHRLARARAIIPALGDGGRAAAEHSRDRHRGAALNRMNGELDLDVRADREPVEPGGLRKLRDARPRAALPSDARALDGGEPRRFHPDSPRRRLEPERAAAPAAAELLSSAREHDVDRDG